MSRTINEALLALREAADTLESEAESAADTAAETRDELLTQLKAARAEMADMLKAVETAATAIRAQLDGENVDADKVEDALVQLENAGESLDSIADDCDWTIAQHTSKAEEAAEVGS